MAFSPQPGKKEKKDVKEKKKDKKDKKEKKDKKDKKESGLPPVPAEPSAPSGAASAAPPEALAAPKADDKTADPKPDIFDDFDALLADPGDLDDLFERPPRQSAAFAEGNDDPELMKPSEENEEDISYWDTLNDEEPIAQTPKAPVKVDADGASLVQVPMERGLAVMQKLEVLTKLSGASCSLNGNLLRVRGPPAVRAKAEIYAQAIVDGRPSSGLQDHMVCVPISESWIDGFREQESSLEEEFGVLCVLFDESKQIGLSSETSRSRLTRPGIIEASWENAWHMARLLGKATGVSGIGKVRIKWHWNGSYEEKPIKEIRRLPEVAILGPHEKRYCAAIKLLVEFEKTQRGIIASWLALQPLSSSLGLSSIDLPVDEFACRRLERQTEQVDKILKATGCHDIIFYKSEKKLFSNGAKELSQVQSVLLVGDRDQRWTAGAILQTWALAFAARSGPKGKGKGGGQGIEKLPNFLAGEAFSVTVPQKAMGRIIGKQGSNLRRLTEETKTFAFTLREKAGRGCQTDDIDDLLKAMFDDIRSGASSDLIIFGSHRNRLAAGIMAMASIEEAIPGYYERDESGQKLSKSVGLDIDYMWLQIDFEESHKKVNQGLVALASNCAVEGAAKLVLISGLAQERARAIEYVRWMVKRRLGFEEEFPNLEKRRDAVSLKVRRFVGKNAWFKEKIVALAERTKTACFYDNWRGQAEDALWWEDAKRTEAERLIFVGVSIEQGNTSSADLLKEAQDIVDGVTGWSSTKDDDKENEAEKEGDDSSTKWGSAEKGSWDWHDDGEKGSLKGGGEEGTGDANDEDKGEGKGKGKGEGKGDGKGDGKGKGKGDNDGKGKGSEKGKDPEEASTRGSGGWQFSAAPDRDEEDKGKGKGNDEDKGKGKGKEAASPAKKKDADKPLEGVKPPQTPALPGLLMGNALNKAPQTPAGPALLKAPQTPGGPGDIRPPQTPGAPGVRPPQTPGPAGLKPPQTPVGPGVQPPQTPAGPFGSMAPQTPGAPPAPAPEVLASLKRAAPEAAEQERKALKGTPPPREALVGENSAAATAPREKPRLKGTPPPKSALVTAALLETAAAEQKPIRAMRGTPPPKSACVSATFVTMQATGDSAGVKPPQTPAGPAAVKPPQTPGGPAGILPPQTPGGPAVKPPQTPGGPAVKPPQTPGGPAVKPPQTPGGPAVKPPQTPAGPAAGVAPPQTPAGVGVAPPQTPAGLGVAAPQTPAGLVGGVAPPQTPVVATLVRQLQARSASKASAVPPPASARIPRRPEDVVPQTPLPAAMNAVPQTPAQPGGGMAMPQTPAAIAGVAGARPAPQTPAAIAKGTGVAVPQTPAAITGAGTQAPQTPAGITGQQLRSQPQTPAVISGQSRAVPQTPAAITGLAKPAPQTPAMISGQARFAPQTPAMIRGSGADAPEAAAPGTPAAILQVGEEPATPALLAGRAVTPGAMPGLLKSGSTPLPGTETPAPPKSGSQEPAGEAGATGSAEPSAAAKGQSVLPNRFASKRKQDEMKKAAELERLRGLLSQKDQENELLHKKLASGEKAPEKPKEPEHYRNADQGLVWWDEEKRKATEVMADMKFDEWQEFKKSRRDSGDAPPEIRRAL